MDYELLKKAIAALASVVFEFLKCLSMLVIYAAAPVALLCAAIWPALFLNNMYVESPEIFVSILFVNGALVFSALFVFAKYTQFRLLESGKDASKWERYVLALISEYH